ncbi:MAG: EamA family transporter [Haloarculaceae archaeon]
MRYLSYTLLALAAYTFVAPLTKLATRDLPSDAVAAVTNGILVLVALAVVFASGSDLGRVFTHPDARFVYPAGVLLAVGILAYYRALALGPVSVVVPVFGLFLVTSSAVGMAFLDEAVTARKLAGIALAVAAVYLTAVE